ncbi:MAG: CAP domain-containing protein [Myxococcota bacterium]
MTSQSFFSVLLRDWFRFPVVLLAGALAASCGTAGDNSNEQKQEQQASNDETQLGKEVLRLVNEERAAQGLGALTWNDDVAKVAYDHSVDMQERNYFDHTNPDGDGPMQRLDKAGVSYSAAGENIAQGYPTPEEVMAAWMNSEGHRANILRPGFTQLGVGVRQGEGGPWWTQVFRTP